MGFSFPWPLYSLLLIIYEMSTHELPLGKIRTLTEYTAQLSNGLYALTYSGHIETPQMWAHSVQTSECTAITKMCTGSEWPSYMYFTPSKQKITLQLSYFLFWGTKKTVSIVENRETDSCHALNKSGERTISLGYELWFLREDVWPRKKPLDEFF